MSSPRTIIGLEVHVQLKTQTKLFCGCLAQFGAPPNTQVCDVCMGLPGALPVLNRRAVELALRAGLALNCKIPERTKWDRKQYFYPDLPKGYQISQFDQPICGAGYLDLEDTEPSRRIRIIRAHLEEDAGKSSHDEGAGTGESRIDLNRCGTPLLEIVSEPDLRSADEATAYLGEVKQRMRHLGVSDCEMQEGSLRVDANVNLHIDKDGETIATPIVEVKNMNSFRAVAAAIEYERQRQWDAWEQTGQTIRDCGKTTRGWNDVKEMTFLQREKEESADYRYFPDPDLLPIEIPAALLKQVEQSMGELPGDTRKRYHQQLGIKPYEADVIVSQGPEMVAYFDAAVAVSGDAAKTATWIGQDVLREAKRLNVGMDAFPIDAAKLGELVARIASGKLDNNRGRDVFTHLLDQDVSVDAAIAALGIESVDESQIETLCRELLTDNPSVADDYRAGKTQAIGRLIGAARKKNANANPQAVRETLIRLIET
ncbi:MAG: Asp-tRNA(Asn)/Glu-tRNA(Gln) amidotransferase subunit GatB [Planctomycetota bacterium]